MATAGIPFDRAERSWGGVGKPAKGEGWTAYLITSQSFCRGNAQPHHQWVFKTKSEERRIQQRRLPTPSARRKHDIFPIENILGQGDLPILQLCVTELVDNCGERVVCEFESSVGLHAGWECENYERIA